MRTPSLKKLLILIITLLDMLFSPKKLFADFYNHHKRGYWWYEELAPKRQNENALKPIAKTPEEAEKQIMTYRRELEMLKYLMVVSPTLENVLNYRKKEHEFNENILKVGQLWEQVNFQYPLLNNRFEAPGNVHAIRIEEDVKKKELKQKLNLLAKDFSFVLFRKEACDFCEKFEPILKIFATEYGFEVEAVAMDKSQSNHFVTQYSPALFQKFHVEGTPTLFLVKRGGALVVEYARGFLTLEELEMIGVAALDYFKTAKNK